MVLPLYTDVMLRNRSRPDFHRAHVVMNRATRPSEVISIAEIAPQKVSPALRKYTEKCEKIDTEAERGTERQKG